MLQGLLVGRRSQRRALLLGTALLMAAPAHAACDTTGAVTVAQCDIEGVDIEVSGSAGSVTLDDFTLDPADHDGYARIYADDSIFAPTAVTVTLSGDTVITTYNYLGMDVRTKAGDISVDIGADVAISAQQTGVYIESGYNSVGQKYDGGEIVVTNRGTIVAGPDANPMASEGIWAVSNGGGVSVSNYGAITTTTTALGQTLGRGIVADGGNLASDQVTVSIYNDGLIDAVHDGMRVNSYNGLGKVLNDVNGVVTSHDRRGVVVWSAANSGELENYGRITALDATAVNVWAEGSVSGDASVINGGTIAAYDNAGSNVTDTLFNGVHIWSEVMGNASLANLSTGTITAEDGWAVWMQSTVGDVEIDNAGLLKGKSTAIYVGADQLNELAGTSLPDHAGAMHGDLTLSNSDLITAFDTVIPASKFGLVTLTGADVGSLSVTNLAGGVIGAGHDFSAGFNAASLEDASAEELAELQGAAANVAVLVGAEADTASIDNQGTLFGSVSVLTPKQLYGVGPDQTGAVLVDNSGLWVTSGISTLSDAALSALFRNSGTIWTLGEAGFYGDFRNEGGVVVVAATADIAASLNFGNDYAATGDSRLAFDLGVGASLGVDPIVQIGGDVSGQTDLVLADLSGWDWKSGGWLDLVTVGGTTDLGIDSFILSHPIHGLVQYELGYDGASQTWSVGNASVSQRSLDELDTIAHTVQSALANLSGDIVNRSDDLRDAFWWDRRASPLGYAESASTPMDAALAALTPPQSGVRSWIKGRGAYGVGDGFAARQGLIELGADAGTTLDGTFVAAGAFGALSGTGLDFDSSGSTADISGTALGVYGTLMGEGGFYLSGTVLAQSSTVDLALSGEAARFNALGLGARFDVGYRTEVAEFGIEPGIGLRAGTASYDDFTISGTDVSLGDSSSLGAEVRLRVDRTLGFDAVSLTPFAVFTLGAERGGDGNIALSELGTVETADADGLYGGVSAGVSVTTPDGALTGYARGDLTVSTDESWAAIKLGASYRF